MRPSPLTALLIVAIVILLLAIAGLAYADEAIDCPLCGVGAKAIDPIEGDLTLGQVRELQIALSSIERREGTCDGKPCSVPVPTCLGDVKPPCIPLAISSAIADDLSALAPQWQFYQVQAHKLIGEASGGNGYVAPGSKEETMANFRLFELNGQKVAVKLRRIDVNGMEASGVQLPPTVKAVLSPISR